MKVPANNVLPMQRQRPDVSETDLMLAAVQMHEMGRLVERDEMAYDALKERTNDETGDMVKAVDGLKEHLNDSEKRRFESVPKRIEKQFEYNRDHPRRQELNTSPSRERA